MSAARDDGSDQPILVERPHPGIVLATLNRPEHLNAISFDMFDAFRRLHDEVAVNAENRVLVITGAGAGFCAGADLDVAMQLAELSTTDMFAAQEVLAGAVTNFRHLPKPVIAAVNGAATGAGFALALAADMRVASTSARFGAASVRLGLSGGDAGTSWLLPRVVGLGYASEIMMTGRLVDAATAYRIGLANRVTEPAELLNDALALAAEISANSPLGLQLTKHALQVNAGAASMESAIAIENRDQVIATRTPEFPEAISRFRAGRQKRDRT